MQMRWCDQNSPILFAILKLLDPRDGGADQDATIGMRRAMRGMSSVRNWPVHQLQTLAPLPRPRHPAAFGRGLGLPPKRQTQSASRTLPPLAEYGRVTMHQSASNSLVVYRR